MRTFGRSLRAKIFAAFVLASVVPLLAAVWVLAAVTDTHLRAGALAEAGTAGALARGIATERAERLVATAQAIALTPGLGEAIVARDRDTILRLVRPWNEQLDGATVAVVDDAGIILLRAYAPDRYGDDVAATTKGLGPALRGQPGYSTEPAGLRGLAIRGFGPVEMAGRTVGVATVTQNLDREFLASLRLAVGLATFALLPDGTAVGPAVDPMVAAQIATADSTFTGLATADGREQAVHAWPLADPDGRVVGILGVVFPLDGLAAAQAAVARAVAGTALLALVAAGLLGWLLSRALLGPVERLTHAARAIAAGGTPAVPAVRTGDELEDLSISLQRMVDALAAQGRRLAELNAHLEEERVRDHALAAASREFAEARLELGAVLASVTYRVAELVGGGCVVRQLSEDGRWLTPVGFHHTDPEALALWRDMLSAPQPSDAGLNGRAVGTGEVQFLPRLSPDEARAIVLPEHRPYVDRFGIGSLVVVPLRAGGRTLGTISIQRDSAERPFSEEDRAFLGDLADRAALAIENARLYELAQQEIGQRRRAEETQRFLADASRALATSLDYAATLRTVARLAVPDLADWCTVNMLAEDGRIHRAAFACADPTKEPLAHELDERYPLDPSASHGVPKVIRTGQVELISEVPERVIEEFARDGEHLALLRQLGLRSFVGAPLVVGGRTVGALALAATQPGRFGPADAALLEELARRAATAVENARLYEAAQAAIRVRDEFLSIAAHELKTPVTVVRGAAQLLTRSRASGQLSDERLERLVATITEGTSRLTALIDDLLDVSRLHVDRLVLRPAEIDLAELVRRVAGRIREQLDERHDVRLELPDDACVATADPDRLEQVLDNLLENAVKYSPEGGTIRVAIDPADERIVLRVRDEGIGLPPDAAEAIFEPFGRAANAAERLLPGMGLGLHVCRGIVEAHGGRIWAESGGVGRGTTLVVELPRSGPAPDDAEGALHDREGALPAPNDAAGPPTEEDVPSRTHTGVGSDNGSPSVV